LIINSFLNISNNQRLKHFSETSYIVIFCLYYFNVCGASRIMGEAVTSFLFTVLVFLLYVIVTLQWITHIDRKVDIFIGISLIVLWRLVIIYNPNGLGSSAWPLLMAASIGMDYKKILKICLLLQGITILSLLITNSVTGDGIVYVVGSRIRSSGGITGFPTDSASLVLFFCIYLFIVSEYESDYIVLIVTVISCLAARYYFYSNTSTYMSLLLALLILYSRIEVRFSKKRLVKVVSALLNILSLVLMPILTIFLLVSAELYGHGNAAMIKLSNVTHGRIGLTWEGLAASGVKPFGVKYELVGAASPGMKAIEYNFLDSSYINILIRYGWIAALLVLSMWTFIVYKGMSRRRRRLVFATIVIAIHSLGEQHFLEMAGNPILWMPLAYNLTTRTENYKGYLKRKEAERQQFSNSKLARFEIFNSERVTASMIRLVLIVIAYFAIPYVLMRFRTIIDVEQRFASDVSIMMAKAVICVFFACFIIIIYFAGKILAKLLNRKEISVNKCDVVFLALAILVSAMLFFFAGIKVNEYGKVFNDEIEGDSDAITLILNNNEYPVYCDKLHELYYEKYKGLEISPYTGSDTVRQLDCTIITDSDDYYIQHFIRGALYGVLSDKTSIYTTDKAVYEALISAGYVIRGYYYGEQEVDFDYEYVSSSIELAPGELILSGNIELCVDKLLEDHLEYEKLEDLANDMLIARLVVESENGEELAENIYYKDFDGNGNFDFNFGFNTKCSHVTVRVYAYYGNNLRIENCAISTSDSIDDQIQVVFDMDCRAESVGIYGGKYELTMLLSAENLNSIAQDEKVGTFLYTTNSGKSVTRTIYARDFENGEGKIIIPFYSNAEYFDFEVTGEGKYNVMLDSFSYVAKPDYDVHMIYNEDGFPIRTEYFDIDGNKTLGPKGFFAVEYDYDKNGNILRESYYGLAGQLMTVNGGYAELKRTYNDLNYITSESYYGDNDEPIMVNIGYWKVEYEVDSYGRQSSARYYDTEGNPVVISLGYAEIHKEYDESDNIIYEAYYDEDGERINMAQGYSACRYDYDDSGNKSVIIYLDDEDTSVMTTWGYAEVHREFDENGRVTVETYYGTAGEIIEIDAGYATVVREYDEAGNNIAIRYFGIDSSEGYIEIIREFDAMNRIVYEAKKDSDGNFIILSGQYCAYRKTYDEDGNVSTITYYGEDGEQIMISGEYAEVHYKYDDNNRVSYEAFFDGNGNGINRNSGYHACGYEYDENNNRVVIRYYDLNDNLMLIDGEYAEIHKKYDESKRVIYESYYGLSGEKVVRNAGFFAVSYEYDSNNNVSDIKYYDINEQPVIISSAVFEIRMTYNDLGRLIREEYFGLSGERVMSISGYSIIEKEYYDDGSVSNEIKYDTDENVIID